MKCPAEAVQTREVISTSEMRPLLYSTPGAEKLLLSVPTGAYSRGFSTIAALSEREILAWVIVAI